MNRQSTFRKFSNSTHEGSMRRLLLCCTLLAACGSTAPDPPMTVTVSSSETRTGTRTTVGGALQVACDLRVTATASGGAPGSAATWSTGLQSWTHLTAGITRQADMTAGDLADWFGSTRIPSGATVTATRTAAWTGPFRLDIAFRYTLPSGEGRSAPYTLTCL